MKKKSATSAAYQLVEINIVPAASYVTATAVTLVFPHVSLCSPSSESLVFSLCYMWCGCSFPLSPGCWLPADCAHRPSIKLITPQNIHPGSSSQLLWWLMLHLSLVYLCSSDSVIYISWPIPAFISSLLCSRTTLTGLHACSQTRHPPAVSSQPRHPLSLIHPAPVSPVIPHRFSQLPPHSFHLHSLPR